MKKRHLLYAAAILSCYLSVHREHLAIWYQPSAQPDRVFPYRVSLFPAEDQAALKKGIPFSSQEELSRLLEDYLS